MTFYSPSTSLEFRAAILEARPGDVILLHPKQYSGSFTLGPLALDLGQGQLPITIQGSYSENGRKCTTIVAPRFFLNAIKITGGKWRLSGLNIESKFYGVRITCDGHTLRDVHFRRTGFPVVIGGDNNQIENVNISVSNEAIIIRGNENCVKNTVLSQIKDIGICIGWTSTGNTIESTTVIMKRNKTMNKPIQHPHNAGWALNFLTGTSGTQVKGSTFSGVACMRGDGGRVKGCKFAGLNLGGDGNEFSDTEICKLFHRGKDNTFLASCKIEETKTKPIRFN